MTDIEHAVAVQAAVKLLDDAVYAAVRDGLRAEMQVETDASEPLFRSPLPQVFVQLYRRVE